AFAGAECLKLGTLVLYFRGVHVPSMCHPMTVRVVRWSWEPRDSGRTGVLTAYRVCFHHECRLEFTVTTQRPFTGGILVEDGGVPQALNDLPENGDLVFTALPRPPVSCASPRRLAAATLAATLVLATLLWIVQLPPAQQAWQQPRQPPTPSAT